MQHTNVVEKGKMFMLKRVMMTSGTREETNKIYITKLSPIDKRFFENKTLKLPRCVEFSSAVPLSHIPLIMPPPQIYTIKDPMGSIKCVLPIPPEWNFEKNEYEYSQANLIPLMGECLKHDPRRIHVVRVTPTSANSFEIWYAFKISDNDIMPQTEYAGGFKRKRTNKRKLANKRNAKTKRKSNKTNRKTKHLRN